MKRFLRLVCVLGLFLSAVARMRALMPSPNVATVNWSVAIYNQGVIIINGLPSGFYGWTNPTPSSWGTQPGRQESLVPGQVYNCSVSWSGIQSYQIYFPAPDGYQVLINGVPVDVAAASVSGSGGTINFTLEVRSVGWAIQADAAPAGTFTGVMLGKAITWGVSGGFRRNGEGVGFLGFREVDLTNSPYSRDRLIFATPLSQVTTICDGTAMTTIRQIMTPKVLFDCVDDAGAGGYTIYLYDAAGWTLGGSPLIYSNASPTLLKKFHVFNPGGSSQLQINEIEGNAIHAYLLTLTSGTVSSGTYTWSLQEGGNNSGNLAAISWLRTTTATSTNAGGGTRYEVQEVKNASSVTASKTRFDYTLEPWGREETTSMTLDYGGTNARTTTFTYYTAASLGDYSHVYTMTPPSGNTSTYTYYNDWWRAGQPNSTYSAWADTASGLTVMSDFANDWLGRTLVPSVRYEWVGAQQTAKWTAAPTYPGTTLNSQPLQQIDSYAYYDASSNLHTRTDTIRGDATDFDAVLRTTAVFNPDGTQQSFQYCRGTYNPSTHVFTVNSSGDYWRELTINGMQSTTTGADHITNYGGTGADIEPIYVLPNKSSMSAVIHDSAGNVLSTQAYVSTGSGAFALMTYQDAVYDLLGRVTSTTANSGATTTNTITDGRLASSVDPAGTETDYSYDVMGRATTVTKKGASASGTYAAQGDIVTTTTFDAANRVTQSVVSGSSLSLTTSTAYDNGGWITSSTAPGSYTTAYSYSSGGKIVTATLPGGATRITEVCLDGRTKSITGTAQVNEFMSYFVDGTTAKKAMQHKFSSGSSNAWKNSYNDWLGRPSEEWQPGWTTGSATGKTWTYNSSGQLAKVSQPGLADTLYVYDVLGQLTTEGLDVNANGSLDLSSNDRITTHANEFFQDGSGNWWQRNKTGTYATASSSTWTQTAKTETQLDGFSAAGSGYTRVSRQDAYDVFGNVTTTYSEVKPSIKTAVATVDTSDSTINAVQKTYNGLLMESTDTAGITMAYGYDALGRKCQDIDPRTGTTTTAYVAGTNQVYTITDPASVVQVTYAYDTAGRVITVTNGLSKVTRYDYDSMGNRVREWGDTTYPVEYAFDSYGRKYQMSTYRGGSSWNGAGWPSGTAGTADTTTWNYDDPTGLLASKTDASSHSVTYTYTQARQLSTRTWSRGVVTTYGYDAGTGEQTSINYSDSTPGITYTYNRLGKSATISDVAGTRTFNYNLAGTLELQSEVLGTSSGNFYGDHRVTYGHDTTSGVVGRLNGLYVGTSSYYANDYNTPYGYDSYGRLNVDWIFTYNYLANSNLISTTTCSSYGYTDTRTYDSAHDWIATRTLTNSLGTKAAFNYTYDTIGRVTQVSKTGELYNRYGNGTQGLTTSYGYDDKSQVTSEQTKLGSTSTVLTGRDDGYAYDPIGNRMSTTHNGNTANYTNNALNEIDHRDVVGISDVAGAASTGATVTVNGSPSGVTRHGQYFFKGQNLSNNPNPVFSNLSVSDGTTTTTLPAFVAGTPESMSYDYDGNLTADGRWDYTYDAENRLIAIQTHSSLSPSTIANADARRLDFKYDYLGRRIEKIVHAGYNGTSYTTTLQDSKFIYDEWNILVEYYASVIASPVRLYGWGLDESGSLHGAGGVGGFLALIDLTVGGDWLLPCYDGKGNLHGLIDYSTGAFVAQYEYDAFGQTIRMSGVWASNNPFRYSSKYTDDETYLINFGRRYYFPNQGRFMGRDPIDEKGGIHLYVFCLNNAVNQWDYLGMVPPLFSGMGPLPPIIPPNNIPPVTAYPGARTFAAINNGVTNYLSLVGKPGGIAPGALSPGGFSEMPVVVPISFGISGTANGTASPTLSGINAQATGGYGIFINPATSNNGNVGSLSLAMVSSIGFTGGPGGVLSTNTIIDQGGEMTVNPSLGVFAGAAGGVWISNAGEPEQLQQTTNTISFNAGFGIETGLSLSYGNGIYQLTFSPPGAGPGVGVDITSTPTATSTTTLLKIPIGTTPSSGTDAPAPKKPSTTLQQVGDSGSSSTSSARPNSGSSSPPMYDGWQSFDANVFFKTSTQTRGIGTVQLSPRSPDQK